MLKENIASMVLGGLIVGVTMRYCMVNVPRVVYRDTGLIKTVAHDEPDMENIQLLCKDIESDVAIYEILEPDKIVVAGAEVFASNGNSYVVTSTDSKGFYFKADKKITTGMSGTAIVDADGNTLGYVSNLVNGNLVRCIWK